MYGFLESEGSISRGHAAELAGIAAFGDAEDIAKKCAELRNEYPVDHEGHKNAVAHEQIRIYDPESGYRDKVRQYKEACVAGDIARMDCLDQWFGEYFPLTEHRYRQEL